MANCPLPLYESHMHTPLCHHAQGEPGEYAAVAETVGLKGIIVTCHNPMPGGFSAAVRMRPEELPHYVRLVRRAAEEWRGRVDVRLGLEADYFPGQEKFLERQLASESFDFVLGSVHIMLPEWVHGFYSGDMQAYRRFYFEMLAQAAETRLFDSLAHPDVVKHLQPETWSVESALPSIRRALDRIAATGVAMELNTSGLHKSYKEMNPGPVMLREMAERGIPVTLGADAHQPGRTGENFSLALKMLAEAGYEEVSMFLERQRVAFPIAALDHPGEKGHGAIKN